MKTGVWYKVGDGKITRHISLDGNGECTSMLRLPPFIDLNQPLDGVYDLAWLASPKMPVVTRPKGEIRAIDLFCGCGGLTLGVREAARALGHSFRCVFASDINPNALEMHKINFHSDYSDLAPIENHVNGELGTPLTDVEQTFLARVGIIDIVVAGPPCQGNSNLNNHTRRDDPKNLLYLRAVRAIEIVRPDSFVIENVPGVLHERHGVLQTAIRHLSQIGYSVSYGVIPMRKIGVAQMRKRMVLIGSRLTNINLEQIIEKATVTERPLSWACADLQDRYDVGDIFNSSATHSLTNQQRIHYLFEHDLYELPNEQRPDCHRLKPHNYPAVYGRMHWDDVAPTITGGFGSCGQGRFVHPLYERTLTPHEAARVQFFPDFFDFGGIKRRGLQLAIGNAVPAKAGYVVSLPLLQATVENRNGGE